MHAGTGLTSPRASAPGGWQRAAHVLAIIAGWALFVWGWHRVLAGHPDFDTLRALVVGAAVVVPVVTLSWILHNRGIHRRKGPRRAVPAATLRYTVDFNGRAVTGDFDALADAQRVLIVVEGEHKRYVAHGADPGAAAANPVGDEPAAHS